jgi:hypothetical protein
MKMPLSHLFSIDVKGIEEARKVFLKDNPVTGVTEKTHWKDLDAAQKDALYKAYYSSAEQKVVSKEDLDSIAEEKPVVTPIEEEPVKP